MKKLNDEKKLSKDELIDYMEQIYKYFTFEPPENDRRVYKQIKSLIESSEVQNSRGDTKKDLKIVEPSGAEVGEFVEEQSKKLWKWLRHILDHKRLWSREDLKLRLYITIKEYEAMRRG